MGDSHGDLEAVRVHGRHRSERGGLRFGVDWRGVRGRWVGEHLLREPPDPSGESVQGVVSQIDRQAAGGKDADHRLHVGRQSGGHRRPRLDGSARPRVAQQCSSGREDPLSCCASPVGASDRGIDLADDEVHHPADEVVLVGHVLVERHRHHVERLRQAAHGEGVQARLAGECDRGASVRIPVSFIAASSRNWIGVLGSLDPVVDGGLEQAHPDLLAASRVTPRPGFPRTRRPTTRRRPALSAECPPARPGPRCRPSP